MTPNPETARLARVIASALAKILENFFNEAQRSFEALARPGNAVQSPPSPATSREVVIIGWVDRKDLAKHLGVSLRTVGNWIAKKRVPYMRLGRTIRFNLRDVDAHLKRIQASEW